MDYLCENKKLSANSSFCRKKGLSILKHCVISKLNNNRKQAGAELGQAQLKLGLDLNSINLN